MITYGSKISVGAVYFIVPLLALPLLLASCSEAATPAPQGERNSSPTTYQECVAAGFPVLKTLPGRCVTPDGVIFIDNSQFQKEASCKNLCGNGNCEEIVCMAIGCPCSENSQNCPEDCKS